MTPRCNKRDEENGDSREHGGGQRRPEEHANIEEDPTVRIANAPTNQEFDETPLASR